MSKAKIALATAIIALAGALVTLYVDYKDDGQVTTETKEAVSTAIVDVAEKGLAVKAESSAATAATPAAESTATNAAATTTTTTTDTATETQ